MNNKALVKLCNIIGITSIILLVYWVFIFISITVFGLKVFKENLTETFYLSVVGILALMFGAFIINIMFNLTRIAEKHNQDEIKNTKATSKKFGLVFGLKFSIDIWSSILWRLFNHKQKRKNADFIRKKSIIENNIEKSNKLVNYSFNEKWIIETSEIINLYGKTDTHFPYVSVIVADRIS